MVTGSVWESVPVWGFRKLARGWWGARWRGRRGSSAFRVLDRDRGCHIGHEYEGEGSFVGMVGMAGWWMEGGCSVVVWRGESESVRRK